MAERFVFLPNARTQVAALGVPTVTPRLNLPFEVTILADGNLPNPVPLSAALRGPGDVIALDRAQIARVDPAPGLRASEPSYFPLIEFVDPDLPWRYSLDAGSDPRLKPWLSLIALKADEFEFMPRGAGPLPAIRVKSAAASLPDLATSWSTAHVQVNLPADTNIDAREALDADPARGLSRIFCFRKLHPRATYFLFLVPAYRAGALAGLGSNEAASPANADAWKQDDTEIELPFYYRSQFTTDAIEDLEQLLRKLRAYKADGKHEAGAMPRASAFAPGYYSDYSRPGANFQVQGALLQPGEAPEPYDTDAALAASMKVTLNIAIEGENAGDDGGEDPLIALPPYGFRFRMETAVSATRAAQHKWFDRVNLDLKMRLAAGTGAEVVRANQELFVGLCWNQYEELMEVNRRLARLRAAEELVKRVTDKHLKHLPPPVTLSLSQSLQPYVISTGSETIAQVLRGAGMPSSYASLAMRRVSAKRPVPLAAKGSAKGHSIPMPRLPGDRSAKLPTPAKLKRVHDLRGEVLATNAAAKKRISELKGLFGATAFDDVERPASFAWRVGNLDVRSLADRIRSTVAGFPKAKATVNITGRTGKESEAIGPIYRSPIVPLPLSSHLVDLNKDALLPGISKLPDNSVTVFEENRAFIESFMVGANHAMNDELRWREFPTDMRGTIFRRFWDRGRAVDDPTGDDISEIHTWNKKLSEHPSPANSDHAADLVVVIKGDIVRKLVDPILVINEADSNTWVRGEGTDHQAVFFGKIGQDIMYYGFDVSRAVVLNNAENVFLVVHEAMGWLRFGMDVATARVRRDRKDHASLGVQFPVGTLGRSYKQLPAKGAPAAPPPNVLATWDDLSWSHATLTGAHYIDMDHTRLNVGTGPDLWGNSTNSAALARACWQRPLAGVLPLKRVS